MPDRNSVAIFSYIGQDVRTVSIDGQPWFVLADIARILSLTNPTAAAGSVDVDDLSTAEVIDSMGRTQAARITNESGLYSLVFQSRKPNAKEFKRWVTHVVLPEIRQTGGYGVQKSLPQTFAEALREFAAEVEAHEATKAALDIAQPRAEAWDAIASAEGDYSVGDAAKILARAGIPTGPQRLFNQLRDIKWTFRGTDGSWRAYADRVENGFLAEKPQFHHHPGTGERVIDPPQLRVTLKGVQKLRQRLHVGALAVVS